MKVNIIVDYVTTAFAYVMNYLIVFVYSCRLGSALLDLSVLSWRVHAATLYCVHRNQFVTGSMPTALAVRIAVETTSMANCIREPNAF